MPMPSEGIRVIDWTNSQQGPVASAMLGDLGAGGDFIFNVVNSVDDLPDDPQVRANDYIVDFEHPQFGTIQIVGVPVRLPAPEFGHHTEEILSELLGDDWKQIGRLKDQEVI